MARKIIVYLLVFSFFFESTATYAGYYQVTTWVSDTTFPWNPQCNFCGSSDTNIRSFHWESYDCNGSNTGSGDSNDCTGNTYYVGYVNNNTCDSSPNTNGNLGGGWGCQNIAGQPVNVTTGNMYHSFTDFSLDYSGITLNFTRTYNSQSNYGQYTSDNAPLGYGWTHNYNIGLLNPSAAKVGVRTDDGKTVYFIKTSSGYLPMYWNKTSFSSVSGGYVWTTEDGTAYRFNSTGVLQSVADSDGKTLSLAYDTGGKLICVSDPFGHSISFTYDTNTPPRIQTVTAPSNKIYTYSYTPGNDLQQITYPDNTHDIYGYDANPGHGHKLVSVQDPNGHYSMQWTYDDSGRCTSSYGEGNNNRIDLTYNTGQTIVTKYVNGNSMPTYYNYISNARTGIGKVISISGPGCSECGGGGSYVYAPNNLNRILSHTDKNGYITTYSNYDSKNNPGTVVEASNSAKPRTTRYTYHPVTSKPTSVARNSALFSGYSTSSTKFQYDGFNNLTGMVKTGYTKNVAGARIPFAYASHTRYNVHGQITQSIDPNGHQTAFNYYTTANINSGQLKSITNHLGHTVSFGDYFSGKPGWTRDTNNILTQNMYDLRGRLIAVTAHTRTTRYGYDAFGNRTSITLPRGNKVGYEYDGANRLIKIRDGRGNYIAYSYDTEGNRMREEVHDSSGTLKKYQDMAYDTDNRLWKVKGFDGYSSVTGYDGNGNVTSVKDKKGNLASYIYDALNRLITGTQPGSIATNYTYDINDNPASLKDGRNNTTNYTYDDLGRLVQTISPDTGTTYYEYDAAGNLVKKKDAKLTFTNYSSDSLNRLTAVHYSTDSTRKVNYTYDSTANGNYGIGRLTGMSDPSGTTAFYYDEYGEIIEEDKTFTGLSGTFITRYSYDDNGNLATITYPDGRVVTYTYDTADNVTSVTADKSGNTKTLADNVQHAPSGKVTAFTYGNGLTAQRDYDSDYKVTYLKSGPFIKRSYSYDPNGNITGIADNANPANSQGFGYDALNRLTNARGAFGSYSTLSYGYDAVGNRTQKTANTTTTTYYYSSSTPNNHLTSVSAPDTASLTYDANGNISNDGKYSLTPYPDNRLKTIGTNGSYEYDGLGRRVKKTGYGITTYFIYDLSGNILTEIDGSGNWKNNRVYLDGEPLARLDSWNKTTQSSASSYSGKICISWAPVAGAKRYKVYWGDTSGYYPNSSLSANSGTATYYCATTNLAPGRTYYFVVKAYSDTSATILIGVSNEMTSSLATNNPSFSHYNYNAVLGGEANCGICHIPGPRVFLAGFGVRTSVSLCYSCHSAAGVGHNRPYGGAGKHPIFVDVTTDARNKKSSQAPVLGSFANGTASDMTKTHLYKGRQVVCMTCHNSKRKPNDPGRSCELTTTPDYTTFLLQNGGWDYNGYLRPVVYRDISLWSSGPPTYIQTRNKYIVPESEYDVDTVLGAIKFHQQQPSNTYIYVTLENDYLRNTNVNNQLCLDCHKTATHRLADCTVCHGMHNTNNLYNVREKIRVVNGSQKNVTFTSTTSMGGRNGVCVVCHTVTQYYNSTTANPAPHYNGQNCITCHSHGKGFSPYTTVLNDLLQKVYAFLGIDSAYASPAPLSSYSMGGNSLSGGASLAPITFDATATSETLESIQPEIVGDLVYYYHNDHLGTPLFMSDEDGNLVWWRQQTPFGETTYIREIVTENLRLPGQYWDGEKNSSYNFYRDSYYPNWGRYGQPDPIGQAGGINVFPYANNNPVNVTDPSGQFIVLVIPAVAVGEALLEAATATAVVTAGAMVIQKASDFNLSDWLDKELKKLEKERKNLLCPPKPNNGKKCYEQYEDDCDICRHIKNSRISTRCYASAAERLGNCRANRPLGPLVTK